jgi:aryl-alcohol dehydrogenase-like predicted oxidoreductase
MDAAREEGINLIDTAECYGDHLSERFVGQAIKRDREKWVLATKFGHHFNDRFDRDQLWGAEEVRKQLEDSLRALETDYVDLYQFHSGGNDVFDNPELWSMLAEQVEAGKIRHLGISIGSNENDYQTGKAPEVGAEAIQVIYNRLQREPEAKVFPLCDEHDLGVLARVPLASGFLSGKYKPGASFVKTDVRGRRDQSSIDETLKEVEKIQAEEVPDGVDMAAWALAWCLKHPEVTSVIPGCKSPEQVKSNASSAALLTTDHPQDVGA